MFEEKCETCTEPLELAWLYHELGRCNLALEQFQAALDAGTSAKTNADAAGDAEWQLNSTLLIAQANGVSSP